MVSQKDARKKEGELYFATAFAERAGLDWRVSASISETNSPDLMVVAPDGEFGLEHTQVFVGNRARDVGSTLRAAEGARAARGKSILSECERRLQRTLHIQFSSHVYRHEPQKVFEFDRISDAHITDVICSLPIAGATIGERYTVSEFDRCTIWIKHAYHSRWEFIQDGVGFVAQNIEAVQAAVADKANKLARYRSSGLTDVRLLVVANRIRNSGKLMLPDGAQIERLGFDLIYFFSYPDQTLVF